MTTAGQPRGPVRQRLQQTSHAAWLPEARTQQPHTSLFERDQNAHTRQNAQWLFQPGPGLPATPLNLGALTETATALQHRRGSLQPGIKDPPTGDADASILVSHSRNNKQPP